MIALKDISLTRIKSENEVNQLYPIVEQIWQAHFPAIIGQDQVDYMLKHYQSASVILSEIEGGRIYYLINQNGSEVGYIAYDICSDYLYLSKLYLIESARGKGYLKQILNYLAELASELGKAAFHLNVNKNNVRTVQIYQHFGFKIVNETKQPLGPYFLDDYEMVKHLK